MRENLMCPAHKGTNKKWRGNYDGIFSGGVVRCGKCDRFMIADILDNGRIKCPSCRHIELVACGEREHGDFKGG
jgi:phage FluMu protein Com